MPLALQLGAMASSRLFAQNGAAPAVMRIGAIGIDSSHLPKFTREINRAQAANQTRCRVTHLWHDQQPDTTEQRWRQFHEETLGLGVAETATLQELLASVDAVMITAVNGHKHRAFATAALEAGKRTFVDKPLACTLEDARAILELSRDTGIGCFSASSLRFASEIAQLDTAKVGRPRAIEAYGPGTRHEKMEGLFFYGVHVIEMVDAIMGPGVKRVRASTSPERDLVDLEYRDGRSARLRLERQGSGGFGATVHGENGAEQFKANSAAASAGLIRSIMRFFETAVAPVPLRDTVENVAVMEAGNQSMKQDAAWIDVPEIQ